MARIRLIHWKAVEAATLQASLEAAGHQVAYVERVGSGLMGHLRDQRPEAVVIDLSRLPSHGRMMALMIRNNAKYRALPLLFIHGEPAKVAQARLELPDAGYASSVARLLVLLNKAKPNPDSIAPVLPTIARPDLSTARKLGLTANSAASVIDPPRDYARAIGPLPEGVELCEEEEPTRALTVWFVHDAAHLDSRLREARRWAARTKLWILWRKGTKGFTQFTIRERCAGFGLVDYKACSVDATWSGMLVTRKK